jgi:hypothetical protein
MNGMSSDEDVIDGRPERDTPATARPTHAADGTDYTLIRWMLSLDHRARFEVLQSGARSLALLLDARPRR